MRLDLPLIDACLLDAEVRFLETQMLLAVMECDLYRPPHRVPRQYLFGSRIDDRRVKRFPSSSTLQGFHRDDSQRTFRDREHPRFGVRDSRRFRADIDRQNCPFGTQNRLSGSFLQQSDIDHSAIFHRVPTPRSTGKAKATA